MSLETDVNKWRPLFQVLAQPALDCRISASQKHRQSENSKAVKYI